MKLSSVFDDEMILDVVEVSAYGMQRDGSNCAKKVVWKDALAKAYN